MLPPPDITPMHLFLAIVPFALFYWASGPKLYEGFPVAGLDGDEVLGRLEKARRRWLANGRDIPVQGAKKVCSAWPWLRKPPGENSG